MATSPQFDGNLLQLTPAGLYCRAGDFYIDPWGKVDQAVITHGHADHARPGSKHYLCSHSSVDVLRWRLPEDASVKGVDYGSKITLGGASVSLHPAGHIRGSAQVRIQVDGEVWVVAGDYKRCPDPTAEPFEVVPCDTFITESTFALPIYQWQSGQDTAKAIYEWWQQNRSEKVTSLLFCYSLGKAQRVLAELAQLTCDTVYLHGAVLPLAELYQKQGINLGKFEPVRDQADDFDYRGHLVIAPPSAHRSTWMKRFRSVATGFASGWMQVRGQRRRQGYQRGFVLSDHADWPGLVNTCRDTGASRVLVTHGSGDALIRYLNEQGQAAYPLSILGEPLPKTDTSTAPESRP